MDISISPETIARIRAGEEAEDPEKECVLFEELDQDQDQTQPILVNSTDDDTSQPEITVKSFLTFSLPLYCDTYFIF